MSRTAEFKAEKASVLNPDALADRAATCELFSIIVSEGLKFFETNHKLLKNLRNAVGGHFSDLARHHATANVEPDYHRQASNNL